MNLSTAQSTFQNLLTSLPKNDRNLFLSWIKATYMPDDNCSPGYFELRTIAEDIKTMLPVEAILSSEKIDHSGVKENDDEKILHVDSFLYEDDHIDALVNAGKLSRNYCKQCKSTDVVPITFISHSMSLSSMEVVFQHMLPDLSDKVLLDVGSRLGAILYGAYHCSSAKSIIGVEMNKDMCTLQNHIIKKYNMEDRIKIIYDNITNVLPLLKTVDVIILNNVFECFMPKAEQIHIWTQLRQAITNSGVLLVTIPSIEESLTKLQIPFNIEDWVQRILTSDIDNASALYDQDLLSDLCLYEVI